MNFIQNLNLNLTGDNLRELLKALGESRLPTRKSEMAALLNEIWQSHPQRLVDKLSEPEIKMLAGCVHDGHAFPNPKRVNAQYGFSYEIPLYTGYREANFILCFVRRLDRYAEFGHELVDGVIERLKPCIPLPPPLEIRQSTEPDREGTRLVRYESERLAMAEARRMLQLVAADKLNVGEKTRLPSAACIKQVKSILCEPETPLGPERSVIWPVLIQQCGWAKPRAGKLKLTPEGKVLLDNFTAKGYADGIQFLVYDSVFDEMFRIPEIKGMNGKKAAHCLIDADVRRENIFDALEKFPVGRWVTIEDAFKYIVASGNRCEVVKDGYCLYICDPNYGTLQGFELGIGQVYFRQLVAETLTTLGLIDSAYGKYEKYGSPDIKNCWGLDGADHLTRYDDVEYLRLTPLGAFCLGAATEYGIPEAEKRTLFKVLPNHEIVVTDAHSFSASDAALLKRFAAQVSDSVWKMDKKSIFQALENGDTIDDIQLVLHAGTANEIPATVLALMDQTAARARTAIQSEEALAVTFRDEPSAILIEQDPVIRPATLGRNGSTVFFRKKNSIKVQGGLRKMGILLP